VEYSKPTDQSNPDAPYIDGNPSAGIPGSIPSAAAIEYPQREIVHCIEQSGQDPSNGDLTQLWKSILKAAQDATSNTPDKQLVHRGANTGTVNDLEAVVDPTITAYDADALYIINLTGKNTGPVTANLNGLGQVPVLRSSGLPLKAGDIFKIAAIVYIAGNFILLNSAQEIAPPGTGLARALTNFTFGPQTGVTVTLTETFTAPYSGVVTAISSVNADPINGNFSNAVFITVAGTTHGYAGDEVPGSSTSSTVANVTAGDVVTVTSNVTPTTGPKPGGFTNASQYLSYTFIPA
jgi:hypothetical protein